MVRSRNAANDETKKEKRRPREAVTVSSGGLLGFEDKEENEDDDEDFGFLEDPAFWVLVLEGDEDALLDYLDDLGFGDLDAERILEAFDDGALSLPKDLAEELHEDSVFSPLWWDHGNLSYGVYRGGW